MYARVVRYEDVSDEQWGIGSAWFRDDYLPMVRDTAGFDGAYLFHDRAKGITMSVTFWADESTAAASGEAVRQHLDKWAAMTGRTPSVETFEVVVAPERGMPRAD